MDFSTTTNDENTFTDYCTMTWPEPMPGCSLTTSKSSPPPSTSTNSATDQSSHSTYPLATTLTHMHSTLTSPVQTSQSTSTATVASSTPDQPNSDLETPSSGMYPSALPSVATSVAAAVTTLLSLDSIKPLDSIPFSKAVNATTTSISRQVTSPASIVAAPTHSRLALIVGILSGVLGLVMLIALGLYMRWRSHGLQLNQRCTADSNVGNRPSDRSNCLSDENTAQLFFAESSDTDDSLPRDGTARPTQKLLSFELGGTTILRPEAECTAVTDLAGGPAALLQPSSGEDEALCPRLTPSTAGICIRSEHIVAHTTVQERTMVRATSPSRDLLPRSPEAGEEPSLILGSELMIQEPVAPPPYAQLPRRLSASSISGAQTRPFGPRAPIVSYAQLYGAGGMRGATTTIPVQPTLIRALRTPRQAADGGISLSGGPLHSMQQAQPVIDNCLRQFGLGTPGGMNRGSTATSVGGSTLPPPYQDL